MWFEISKLPRVYNSVREINKMIFDNSDKLRCINNNNSFYTNDPIINIIIHNIIVMNYSFIIYIFISIIWKYIII